MGDGGTMGWGLGPSPGGAPPSPGDPEALTPARSLSGPGSIRTPRAAWRTWLRVCAARQPSLSTCECWRTCCACRLGRASRSLCAGCARTFAVNSARRRRRMFHCPSGLWLPDHQPPSATPVPLPTPSPSWTRTPRPAAPCVRVRSRCDAPPGLLVWAGLGFTRLRIKLFIEGPGKPTDTLWPLSFHL